ncbi:hypothetical protein N431DRAFT_69753 [Stipitochalara longipes BDJ]|nr:hypothetical protein N431DRAFT_69753 [Stipitochalara longipes BDJ]
MLMLHTLEYSCGSHVRNRASEEFFSKRESFPTILNTFLSPADWFAEPRKTCSHLAEKDNVSTPHRRFTIRGLFWTECYFPEGWLTGERIDEVEKDVDFPSMITGRKESIPWLCGLDTELPARMTISAHYNACFAIYKYSRFEDAWIQFLADLGRYRMAIEDGDFRDKEVPVRRWRHGVHSSSELFRYRFPPSSDHMLAFILLAYSMMAFYTRQSQYPKIPGLNVWEISPVIGWP